MPENWKPGERAIDQPPATGAGAAEQVANPGDGVDPVDW
ncbi:MAG: hypothetical protein KDK53_16105 [Maritimibacter sp.]|nr:hypothetical protein [Maritimibacter sp.]